MSALLRLVQLVLRIAPQRLWWVLASLVFSLANLVFSREIWPNTPVATVVFTMWAIGCGILLPWLAARVAWLVAEEVESFFWKALWRLAAIVGYGGAALLSLVGIIAVLIKL
ncbi:hypothetical protein [Hymenobacter chitinivorans]|uniref:Uncharacterized protein n=1 Tax=Hymenobacter chitinivorans DSM 11115 TaxID=1121954 RepID=A0A2M9BAR1_9BACT|nr:hypothetical protein [Hymenobacter chitinivorans]PJJ55025.1 hypothetical protein CLV45_3374 [Hymenobacter chitinivorans DSM 11115]